MAVPLTRIHLSRRAFLRGSGASLALPLLDAMVPAMSATPPPPRRALFVFAPNGKKMDEWTPAEAGALGELPWLLAPLAPVRDQLTVVTGLDLDAARSHGDGPGDHARACAAFLTCAHPVKTAGPDLRVGVSVDQVLAAQAGGSTRFRSLELGLEPGRAAGNCDSGYACAYVNHVAWRTPTQPLPKETDPRAVFGRLFADPDEALDGAARAARLRRRRSVLDLVREDARRLAGSLSAGDRARLALYLESVREVEQRITREADERARVPVPEGLRGQRGIGARLALLYELLSLAFQADLVRVATLMVANGGSNLAYPFLGVAEGHHTLSHHGRKPENLAALRKINRFHVERLAEFLLGLAAVPEGEGRLLDHCVVVYGSGISDGDRHNHDDLPILVAGGAGAVLRGGQHLVVRRRTPLANLYLTILDRAGVAAERFADSTGRLPA